MKINATHRLSRRDFVMSAGMAAAAAWMRPRALPAQGPAVPTENLVTRMRREAGSAKIVVEKLGGNIAVLIGSGGNIAVHDGKDGKLLVDAGMAGSKSQ